MENLIGSLDQCLPASYKWLESLEIATDNQPRKDAWNLVAVAANNGKIKVLSQGLGALAEKIALGLDQISWTASDKITKLNIDGYRFIVAAKSTIKTTEQQLARQLGLDMASALLKTKTECLAIGPVEDTPVADLFEGLCIGFYDRSAFKSSSALSFPKKIFVPEKDLSSCGPRKVMAQSLVLTKWLQDAPSNFLDPQQFAEIAQTLFGSNANVTVMGRKELEEKSMGAFLAVAKGSPSDPKLVTIEIAGRDTSRTVGLVGKGVTFDTGGVNIKPSPGLEDMKFDMSGAAAVYGAAHYLIHEQPPVNVVCAIGAVENMPSGTAIKPGDIVKSASGKTVEILNTDAEGRLVLADVLTHVIDTYKPELLLDVATLTGAVLFGLGHAGAAIMTPDNSTAETLIKIGQSSGEALWQLPLWPELEQEVVSELADLKNLPKPVVKAGTIMGGWFLHEFVKDSGARWAHIDIAGTAWNCSATGYPKSGGSGFGVRTLVGACQSFEV